MYLAIIQQDPPGFSVAEQTGHTTSCLTVVSRLDFCRSFEYALYCSRTAASNGDYVVRGFMMYCVLLSNSGGNY